MKPEVFFIASIHLHMYICIYFGSINHMIYDKSVAIRIRIKLQDIQLFTIDHSKLHMTVMLQYLQLFTVKYNKMFLGNLME
jgi:hypothetical protein